VKPKATLLCAVAVAIAAATSGCSMQTHAVAPTAQVIKQIGLPVYPNSKPQFGMDTNESMGSAGVHQLSVSFHTRDNLDRVQRFYAERLPKNARKIVLPLGIARAIAYQWYDKTSQKQVMLMSFKDETIIQLRSMQFGSATPTAHP
jgi:hypothetical protein